MSSGCLPLFSADSTRSTSISSATTSTSSLAISSRKRWSSYTPSALAMRFRRSSSRLARFTSAMLVRSCDEQVLGVGPALVLLADQVLGRHLDVVEEDLVDLGLAVEHA